MKKTRIAIALLAATLSCGAQVLNYNEYSTAPAGASINGNRLTNVTAEALAGGALTQATNAATNAVAGLYQPASANLTNYSGISTNTFANAVTVSASNSVFQAQLNAKMPTNMNTGQFVTNAGGLGIKPGATVSNLVHRGSEVFTNGGIAASYASGTSFGWTNFVDGSPISYWRIDDQGNVTYTIVSLDSGYSFSGAGNFAALGAVNGQSGTFTNSIETSNLHVTGIAVVPTSDGSGGQAVNVDYLTATLMAFAGGGNQKYISKNGSDDNVGDINHPWLTIAHAIENATGIVILDGLYDEAPTQLPDGVNLFFMPGSGILYTGSATNIFEIQDGNHNLILGYGTFERNSATTEASSVFVNNGGSVVIQGISCYNTNFTAEPAGGTHIVCVDANAGTTILDFHGIVHGWWSGAWWDQGQLVIEHASNLKGTDAGSYYGFNTSDTASGDCWITVDEMTSPQFRGSTNATYWLRCSRFNGNVYQSGGKVYLLTTGKIGPRPAEDTVSLSLNGGRFWGALQKVATQGNGSGASVSITESSTPLDVQLDLQNSEDTIGNSGFVVDISNVKTNSKVFLHANTLIGTATQKGISITGSTNVTLDIRTVDTSASTNSPLVFSGVNTNIDLGRIRLIASNGVPSISATTFQTVLSDSVRANTDPSINVVFKEGPLTVTAGSTGNTPTINAPYGSKYYKAGATNFWTKQSGGGTNWTATAN